MIRFNRELSANASCPSGCNRLCSSHSHFGKADAPLLSLVSPSIRSGVALNGGSFIALKDAPGPCPGPGWQLIASQGKRGAAGEKGERGPPGPRGDAGASGVTIRDWKIDRARYVATPVMSDGSEGPQLELRGLFEQFFSEVR